MKWWTLLVAALLLTNPAAADDVKDREVHRLSMEMKRLAEKNAWIGVERSYWAILDLGMSPARDQHLLAADAALQRGDVLSMIERLEEAQAIEKTQTVTARMDALLGDFGHVRLVSAPGTAELAFDEAPFRPDQAAAIDLAANAIADTGRFDGFLPPGMFRFGGREFEVLPRTNPDPIDLTGASVPRLAYDSLSGVQLPRMTTVGGRRLHLNGMSVREKAYIDVYVIGLYLPVPTDRAELAIRRDEPKRLVMHFVYRKVSRNQLVSHWLDAFDMVPEPELFADRAAILVSWMRDVKRNDRIVFDYVPGKGTIVTVSDHRKGVIEGADFHRALWSVWLGDNPPTAKVKRGLLSL